MATAAAGRKITKLKGIADKIIETAVVKSKDAGAKSVELVKGTTLRDVFDKSKVLFAEKPKTLMPGARTGHPQELITGDGGPAIGGATQDFLWVEEADAVAPHRCIVVAHRLPLRAEANPNTAHGFEFFLDNAALPLVLYRNLPSHVIFVGTLPSAAIPASEQLATYLFENFSCSPVFLGVGLQEQFDSFCERYLLPLTPGGAGSLQNFNLEHYRAFITTNIEYADRVCDLLDPEEDLVFVHEYHLCALPAILRKRWPPVRIISFQ